MAINKYNILKNVSRRLSISLDVSSNVLETFVLLIKKNSISNTVKLNKFGSFKYKKTPQRAGRNPKTKESYIIPAKSKLGFKASNKIKEIIN
jgi:nucleoid DNA-binding protein